MVAEQLLLDLDRPASFAATDFLLAPTNRDALAWLERFPDWPGPALVLHGPSGSGKSHLARMFAVRRGGLFLDPAALPAPDRRPPDRPLILDPATPVDDETGLLHLYTWLGERGGHLLLTARTPVADWRLRLADLRSRLQAAPSVGLGFPDDDLLAALLVKLFDDRQIRVEAGVIDALVRRMERSYAAALQVVEALDLISLRRQRRITRAMARQLLATSSTSLNERREQDGSRDQG